MSNAEADAGAPPYRVGFPERHFIGGEWREPQNRGRIEIVSPSSEDIVATVAAASPADIDLAVQAARKAFDSGPWPRLAPGERAQALDRLALALERRAGELAWVASLQMGAPLKVSSGVTAGAISIYRQFAELARQYPFEDV